LILRAAPSPVVIDVSEEEEHDDDGMDEEDIENDRRR
jgi:hypothetical protein